MTLQVIDKVSITDRLLVFVRCDNTFLIVGSNYITTDKIFMNCYRCECVGYRIVNNSGPIHKER